MINVFAFNKWIAALESGKYKRTTGRLKDEKGHCCLGVLCEVFKKVKRQGIWTKDKGDGCRFVPNPNYRSDSECSVLPEAVVAWAGLSDQDPIIKGPALSERNDTGLSFKKIAALLRTHVKKQIQLARNNKRA